MIKVLELFAGYGSQALALENLGIEFTSDIAEIDKYAIQAYEQLHGKTHNWGDVTKIDETKLPHYDLITYSFPCQDISLAGLQKGCDNDSGTRSSLLWECERIIRAVKPKYLLMENVKNLVGEKHKHNFIKWLHILEMLGYQNYYKVLNAKDYGVPQNRERVFVVSILGCQQYLFPNPIKLEKRLKDVLESDVDEMYYLSEKTLRYFLDNNKKQIGKTGFVWKPKEKTDCANAIRAGTFLATTDNTIIEPLALDEQNKCLRTDGTVGTLMARDYKDFGNQETNGVIEPAICASRGRNPENPSDRTTGAPTEQRLEVNQTGCSNTLTTVQKDNYLLEPQVLTPKRNEYGKAVRKEYEAGNFIDSRHNMTDMQPRADGVTNTLTTVQKDNYVIEPLRIREATQKGYAESYEGDSVTLDEPNSQTRRGRVGKQMSNTLTTSCNIGVVMQKPINLYPNSGNPQSGRVYNADGISPTMDTCTGGNRMPKIKEGYRIRKLTPREYWRLMGVKDEQFDKLHDISNSQLYKLAGNSIAVDVLMGIFKNLLLSDEGTNGQLRLI